jgi:hypothetical protein
MNKHHIAVAAILAVKLVSGATTETSDLLGAHVVHGRGCAACHAAHGGGRSISGKVDRSKKIAAWGDELTPDYGTLALSKEGIVSISTIPDNQAIFNAFDAHDSVFTVILCLSCHDGTMAKRSMIKSPTFEPLPGVDSQAPTFLDPEGRFINQHPVGPQAVIGCGGVRDWDCTDRNGVLTAPPGSRFSFFQKNYGFTVKPAVVNGSPTLTCTSCHDPHSMTIWNGEIRGIKANYETSFFLRGPFTPGTTPTSGSTFNNVTVQFCRNCHGGWSNEMHGLLETPTLGVKTVGSAL